MLKHYFFAYKKRREDREHPVHIASFKVNVGA